MLGNRMISMQVIKSPWHLEVAVEVSLVSKVHVPLAKVASIAAETWILFWHLNFFIRTRVQSTIQFYNTDWSHWDWLSCLSFTKEGKPFSI